MGFKDTGILPEDSKYFQEAESIFNFAISNSDMNPALLIAALLRLKSESVDEDEFIAGMRQFKKVCESEFGG